MENEIWKPIPGYEEYYEVSSLGSVRRIKTGRILKPCSINGYSLVILTINNKKGFLVHRLVAQAFIPNPDNKSEVNHMNGIKTDNRVENLEWVTSSENMQHAYMMGLNKGRAGHHNSEEHRRKISKANKGKHVSEQSRMKMSESLKGRHLSEETRRKIRDSKKGKSYVNNGTECHMASPEKLQEYLDNGYVLGKLKR